MIARALPRLSPIPFASPLLHTSPAHTNLVASSAPTTRPRVHSPAPKYVTIHPTVQAKFLGQGVLNISSPLTNRHYRFQGHGDCQAVDTRDVLMLRRVAELLIV